MGKVVVIGGGELPTLGEPHVGIVKECEELLERAKSGDLIGLVTVGMCADMSVSSGFVGSSCVSMIGSLAIRSAELVERHK
jgi:hypothetical protein